MELERQGNLMVSYSKKDYPVKKRSRSFLPEISSNRHRHYGRGISATKPTMLKSEGNFKFR